MKKNNNALPVTHIHSAKGLWYVLLLLFLCGSYQGHAQTIVPATQPDIPLGPAAGGGKDLYINSAAIDYSPNCPSGPGACGNNQFFAVVEGDGTQNLLYVRDGVTTLQFTLPIGALTADVAIANSTNPFTPADYLVGVVFSSGGGVPPGNDIFLWVYDFTNVGGTSPTLSLVGTTTYDLSNNGSEQLYPHIDILSDATTIGPGGLPLCDQFMVTWTDVTSLSPQNGINIYYASMNNPSVILSPGATIATDPTPVNAGQYGDIATVSRNTGSSIDVMGLYTYHDASGNLYYNEWDGTTGTFGTAVPYDNPSSDGEFTRIDGIDDPSINPFVVPYVIACRANTTIRIYDPPTGFGGLDISSPLLSGFANWAPTVTAGTYKSKSYTVGYYTEDGHDDMYAESIEISSGIPVGYPAFDYFQVNRNPIIPHPAFFTCVSSSCNTGFVGGYSQYMLACWVSQNRIFYKLETAPPFKPAGVNTVQELTTWGAYPNPIKDELTLTAPADQLQDATYTIGDIIGRIVLNGAVTTASQQVNTIALPSGMYIVNLYNGKDVVKTKKIVKE